MTPSWILSFAPRTREYDAAEYTSASAQASVGEALRQLGNKVDAVYCATDSLSGGCVAAVQAANVTPYPLITGMDASVSADQRIELYKLRKWQRGRCFCLYSQAQ